MSDLLSHTLVPATIGSVVLLTFLSIALFAERTLRNRRERHSRARRAQFGDVLAEGRGRASRRIGRRAARHFSARGDLVDALALARWSTVSELRGHTALREAAERDAVHRDVARRAVGVSLLGVVGDGSSVELLVRVLREDPDGELRLIASRALRVRGDEAAAWELIRALRDGVVPASRIVEQLARPFAAPALLEALGMAEFSHVRADLAEALGYVRHEPAALALARLSSTGDERERMKACRALGSLASPAIVPALIRALEDQAWTVRAQAATALGACASASAVVPLAHALADQNWWVRANSASSLRRCGDAGRDALRDAEAHHPDRYARDRAAEALALDSACSRAVAA